MEVVENIGENGAAVNANGVNGRSRFFSLNLLSRDFSAAFLYDMRTEEHIARFLHPSGVFCPACGVAIEDPTTVDRFYHLQEKAGGKLVWDECYCPSCGKRFTPFTGTILVGAHDKKAVFLIALFTRFGADAQTIAEHIDRHPDMVRIWQHKFRAMDK